MPRGEVKNKWVLSCHRPTLEHFRHSQSSGGPDKHLWRSEVICTLRGGNTSSQQLTDTQMVHYLNDLAGTLVHFPFMMYPG